MIIDREDSKGIRGEKKEGLEDYSAPYSDFSAGPPAYSSTGGPSTSSSVVVAAPQGNTLAIAAPPSVPTNGVCVATVLEPIRGSWLLDPLAPQSSGPTILQTLVSSRAGRRPRNLRNMLLGAPTAKFDSRVGDISVALRVVGESPTPATATIQATTRRGNIVLELVSKSVTRAVQFDAFTRSGNITLLIPRSFSGLVELRARSGGIELLPALASAGRVVKSTHSETVVLVGNGALPQVGFTNTGDLARLSARSGCVRLGFSGEDTFTEREGVIAMATHLFQKLATKSASS